MLRKWQIQAWPDGRPRYVTHRRQDALGGGVPQRLQHRTDRAARAAQVHRSFPETQVELAAFSLQDGLWGQDGEPERLEWCSVCGRELRRAGGEWSCMRCGSGWQDEVLLAAHERYWVRPQPGEPVSGPCSRSGAAGRMRPGAVVWPEQRAFQSPDENHLTAVHLDITDGGEQR